MDQNEQESFIVTCSEENAVLFADWIRNRGGVAVWVSLALEDMGRSVSTPVNDAQGVPVSYVSWRHKHTPDRVAKTLNEVGVERLRTVFTFKHSVGAGGVAACQRRLEKEYKTPVFLDYNDYGGPRFYIVESVTNLEYYLKEMGHG